MTTVDIPELTYTELVLKPREVRGSGVVAPPGRVALGGPFWTALPADSDPAVEPFRGNKQARWVLGVLALSLDVGEGAERYLRAWVDVTLSRKDGEVPEPVVWSMKPDRTVREVTRSTKVSLGPSLTIADLGIDASVERGTERTLEEVSLEALYEKTPRARWTLHRTKSAELRGCTRLALVVMAPTAAEVTARVDVGLVSAHRKMVFWWAETEYPQPARTSVLP